MCPAWHSYTSVLCTGLEKEGDRGRSAHEHRRLDCGQDLSTLYSFTILMTSKPPFAGKACTVWRTCQDRHGACTCTVFIRGPHCSFLLSEAEARRLPGRYQAMVPTWDAVNHVTGQCNTRLHHCAESGALQMIATAPILKGQQVHARPHNNSSNRILR